MTLKSIVFHKLYCIIQYSIYRKSACFICCLCLMTWNSNIHMTRLNQVQWTSTVISSALFVGSSKHSMGPEIQNTEKKKDRNARHRESENSNEKDLRCWKWLTNAVLWMLVPNIGCWDVSVLPGFFTAFQFDWLQHVYAGQQQQTSISQHGNSHWSFQQGKVKKRMSVTLYPGDCDCANWQLWASSPRLKPILPHMCMSVPDVCPPVSWLAPVWSWCNVLSVVEHHGWATGIITATMQAMGESAITWQHGGEEGMKG